MMLFLVFFFIKKSDRVVTIFGPLISIIDDSDALPFVNNVLKIEIDYFLSHK